MYKKSHLGAACGRSAFRGGWGLSWCKSPWRTVLRHVGEQVLDSVFLLKRTHLFQSGGHSLNVVIGNENRRLNPQDGTLRQCGGDTDSMFSQKVPTGQISEQVLIGQNPHQRRGGTALWSQFHSQHQSPSPYFAYLMRESILCFLQPSQ